MITFLLEIYVFFLGIITLIRIRFFTKVMTTDQLNVECQIGIKY